jgi:hypothetical protein
MRRAFPIAALVVTAVLPAALVVPVGAVHDAGSQFVIELEADGDATVTVVDDTSARTRASGRSSRPSGTTSAGRPTAPRRSPTGSAPAPPRPRRRPAAR